MDNKNRISIRVNGKDRLKEDKRLKKEPAAAEEKDFDWVLPQERQAPPVINLEERKKQHQARKKKQMPGAAPKLPFHRKKKTHSRTARKKKGDRNWNWPKKQWLSGFSAVIVGLVMGIAVLMMFTDHDTKQASAKWKQNQETEKEAGTSAASGSETAAVPQDLGMTLQIVQGAAFSTKANGKSAVDNLRDSGFAAVLNQDENSVHMFIGVGLKESNSEALGKLYKKQGQDFYVKTFQIQAQSDQVEQKTAVFLGKAEPIMKKMIAGSVSGLTSPSGQAAFTDNQWAELETQMKQLKNQAGGNAGTLADELNAAMKSLKKYRGSSDPAALWQAQQALLRAVLSYQSLIE